MKNAYIPAPTAFVDIMAFPKETNPPYTNGHIKNNITETIIELIAVTIATLLLPLKNPKASGSLVFFKSIVARCSY